LFSENYFPEPPPLERLLEPEEYREPDLLLAEELPVRELLDTLLFTRFLKLLFDAFVFQRFVLVVAEVELFLP